MRLALQLATVAAAYLLWLCSYLVLGDWAFGPRYHYWAECIVMSVAVLFSFRASQRMERPYSRFLLLLVASFLMLAVYSPLYNPDPQAQWVVPGFDRENAPSIAAVTYAAFLFLAICAWGYLAVEQWQLRPPSPLTVIVFFVLTFGLAAIVAAFYHHNFLENLSFVPAKLDAVTVFLEFTVLICALASVLLGAPMVLAWLVFAMAMLAASDLLYYDQPGENLATKIVWTTGLFLLLAGVIAFHGAKQHHAASLDRQLAPETPSRRSGLSGALLLLSVGALLLAASVSLVADFQHPVTAQASSPHSPWKLFLLVLFLVTLVLILVWITDRFDHTVDYLRSYTNKLHQQRMIGDQWRQAAPRVRTILRATGLGDYLDYLRESSARLRSDVLFLGPERLFSPPKASGGRDAARCFIVMPFSQEWSNDVHRILADACRAAHVQPVRGDDLFTPTDILEDIWQGINGADFVMADITGKNPNVLYELGIAHSLAKPVLILSREAADIPIDLSTRRVMLYGPAASDWQQDLREKADKAIAEILRTYDLHRPYGPVPETVSGTSTPGGNGTCDEDAR